jgi:hypothetical protein
VELMQLDTQKHNLALADSPGGLTIDIPGREPFVLRRGGRGEKWATVTRIPSAPPPASPLNYCFGAE